MLSLFWKKLFLINVSLFLIILKIYGYYMHVREENPITPSLFPEEDENGYPFFDQIVCNLQSIFKMTHQLADSPELSANDTSQGIDSIEQLQCPFGMRLLLCKGNKHCFHQLETTMQSASQTNYTLTNDIKIIDELYRTNCFHFGNNTEECQEISLYQDILSGYLTYKALQESKNNVTYIKEHISSSYDKLNALFLLLSFGIKAGIDLGETYLLNNDSFCLKTSKECIQLNNLDPLSERQINQFIHNLHKVKEIIQCVKSNTVYSQTKREIEEIETIIKSLFDMKSNRTEEKQNIKPLLKGMIISIHDLFVDDFELKQKTSDDVTNFRLFNIIFWSFMAMFVLFVNRYFIKHQEFYSVKSKKFFGKPREAKNQIKVNESKEKQEQSKPVISSNNTNNTTDKMPYSKEDLEYIEKLKNLKGNTEFIITK